MEQQILQGLINIGAIKINLKEPFIWTSGIKSPIYCDNRLSIGDYNLRHNIATELTRIIKENYPECNLIGACATAGIPHGTSIADNLKLPMIYFRSKPKGHGTNSLVEGKYTQGQNVVIVEDLISTAKSVKAAIEEARNIGLNVLGVVSIVNYNLPISQQNLKELDVDYKYIISYEELKKHLNLSEEESLKLKQFFDNPLEHNIFE